MNHVFHLMNPVYDMDTYIFAVSVYITQVAYESNTLFFSSFRVFNR